MKAFSKIPDPFGQHLETAKFEFPFKTVLKIEAISQGKIHNNVICIGAQVHHIINNPNNNKRGVLSLDLSQDQKEEAGQDGRNTAMTEGNQTSKQLEGKQKLNEVEKASSEKGQKVRNIFACEGFNIQVGQQRIVETSGIKRIHLSSEQKLNNLRLESNQKEAVSHIVFSTLSQQNQRGLFQKKPIFVTDRQASPTSKNIAKQQPFQPQVIFDKIIDEHKQTNELNRFLNEKDSFVEQHIECSFFNNSIEKEDPDQMKNTGFNLIESVVNIFKDDPKRPKSYTLLDQKAQKQKQSQNPVDFTFLAKKDQPKNLGGKKLTSSRASQKSSLKPAKLQLIKPITINPVFF